MITDWAQGLRGQGLLKADPAAAASPDLAAAMDSDFLQLIGFAQDAQAAMGYAQHRDLTQAFDEIDAARGQGGDKQVAGESSARAVVEGYRAERQLRQWADAAAAFAAGGGASAAATPALPAIAGGVQLCAYAMMPFPVMWPGGGRRMLTHSDIRQGMLPMPYLVAIASGTSHQFGLPTTVVPPVAPPRGGVSGQP